MLEMLKRIENYGSKLVIESTSDGYYAVILGYKDEVIIWTERDSYSKCISDLDFQIREKQR